MSDPSRTPRASETRDSEKKKVVWKPSSNLPVPNPRDGLEFRYVRAATRGEVDNVNFSKAQRDYWVPVKASEYPELKVMSDRGNQFPEGVVIGGLVLCVRDSYIGDQVRAHGDAEMKQQIDSVNNDYFRDPSGGMKKFNESRSRVGSFGEG